MDNDAEFVVELDKEWGLMDDIIFHYVQPENQHNTKCLYWEIQANLR